MNTEVALFVITSFAALLSLVTVIVRLVTMRLKLKAEGTLVRCLAEDVDFAELITKYERWSSSDKDLRMHLSEEDIKIIRREIREALEKIDSHQRNLLQPAIYQASERGRRNYARHLTKEAAPIVLRAKVG